VLIQRCQKNQSYSLRAFARSLNVSSSALSAMLNGKRTITPSSIEKLSLALGLGPKEIQRYKILSKVKGANGEDVAQDDFQQITMDSFAIISDWYHYAILELIRVKGFKSDLTWVSRSLGITKSEVNIAVERLKRMGLLKITSEQKWIDESTLANQGKATNITGHLTSAAARKFQRQVLEKSIVAIEEIPLDLRNHTSLTLAMNPEDIPLAVEKIKNFRRELAELIESNKNPTAVYNVAISLYPVTKFKSGDKS